ncbi:hypothetical protein N8723_02720 [Luminiphilus sp.]|jgi:hypothetical protein|nr:hypothetical protein [Luminiphilus sp.]MDA8679383.1 hypothetical protein [Luminiphilus sp.]
MQSKVGRILVPFIAVVLSAPHILAADLPIYNAACVPVFNGGNHCTSNALSFDAVSIEPDRTHCNAGDEINLSIGITLGSGKLRNAAQRYNVGIWIGEHGEPAIARSRMADNPPDHLIAIPRNKCGTLEFDRSAEMVEYGYRLAEEQLLGKL